MIAGLINYFKDPENLSILLFVGYVILLTHIVLAFVLTMCWIS